MSLAESKTLAYIVGLTLKTFQNISDDYIFTALHDCEASSI